MSSAIVDTLKLATKNSIIYGGFFVFIIGIIGNIFNIIIFTSLKTFRQTSAGFYMNITSAVGILQLIVGLVSRIMITGYDIDATKTSLFICKARQFGLVTTLLISFTYKCFAVIDQYLSLTHRWHHLCNVKVASRLVIVSAVFWCLHDISAWIFQDIHPIPSTNQTTCSIANPVFNAYMSQFVLVVLVGFLPLIIRIVFGLLAFVSVRGLQHRQDPVVRLEREKQLTAMVLVEVLVDVIVTLPYNIYNQWYTNAMTFSDPISSAQNQLIIAIIRVIFHGNFAFSFYIYYCVSSRFRKQLAYVLIDIHLKRWHDGMNRMNNNQIAPEIMA